MAAPRYTASGPPCFYPPVPMRTLYDSVTASDIPPDAPMVAGYITGRFVWSDADWARFPPSTPRIRIATYATNAGDVLDCEAGDATPLECRDWIAQRQSAGLARPTIYCSRGYVPAVQRECAGLTYAIWVADWTGVPHTFPYAVATQYANPTYTNAHYDLSCVYDDTWFPSTIAPSFPSFSGRFIYYKQPMMHGSDILAWQNKMRSRGWALSADSYYGRQSEAVCKAFQREKGLTVDGVIGPKTWEATWTAPVT